METETRAASMAEEGSESKRTGQLRRVRSHSVELLRLVNVVALLLDDHLNALL